MMNKTVLSDKPSAIVTFLLGAGMYYGTYFFGKTSYSLFGSGTETIPRACAALMMLFSIILYFQSAKRERKAKEEISGIIQQLIEDRLVYLMFGMTALYIFLFSRLGFISSTFVFTFGATWALGKGKIKWWLITIIAAAISLGAYFFFSIVLNVIVPSGILI